MLSSKSSRFLFQLTRPVRGEPKAAKASKALLSNFNSLAPCGANQAATVFTLYARVFQLTRPVRGEPMRRVFVVGQHTHFNSLAPCGANRPRLNDTGSPFYFNSLAPCGANPSSRRHCRPSSIFQLTRPVWGEPHTVRDHYTCQTISTHSPRVGRTFDFYWPALANIDFNSLAPCGANLLIAVAALDPLRISTHSPRVGRTFSRNSSTSEDHNFNSLAPCGANHLEQQNQQKNNQFQLTRPVWGEPNQNQKET